MGEVKYSAQERIEMVRVLLEDPVFRTLHSRVAGPELFRTYIKNAKKNSNDSAKRDDNHAIDYSFYKKLDIAQQLLILENQRVNIPHHPTDADYHPDFFDREDDSGSDLIREGNLRSLDERVRQF